MRSTSFFRTCYYSTYLFGFPAPNKKRQAMLSLKILQGRTTICRRRPASLRHMKGPTYRCFLPDLAGFMSLHCARLKDRGTTLKSIYKFLLWRRERDSNPRYRFQYTRFPGVLLQPLGHLSNVNCDLKYIII